MGQVLSGLDRLQEYRRQLSGKRLGLLTTPAAITAGFSDSIEAVRAEFSLAALFSPEHGVRGDRQAGEEVDSYTDERTGIPVYSIYGKKDAGMKLEDTEHFDLLLADMPDVGCRFYTYLAALFSAMDACSKAGKPLLLLDRPNPAGCLAAEGNLPPEGFRNIVCPWRMPQRYGMTIGELAQMVADKEGLPPSLSIIPAKGYRRDMPFEETGLPYVNASPNLPNLDAIRLYSGTCLLEGTCLSEGRGTTHPFEMAGAPWIDPYLLAERMESYQLPGVRFRPCYFTPTFSKHQGSLCGGVQIHLTGGEIRAVEIGLRLLWEMKRMSDEEGFWIANDEGVHFIDRLMGSDLLRQGDFDPDTLLPQWAAEAESFRKASKDYFLYP